MVTEDLKQLLEHLNERLTLTLETAVGFAVNREHYEVSLEHLLVKLLDDQAGDLQSIFRYFGVDPVRVREALMHELNSFRTGNTSRPSFSPILLELVEEAVLISTVHHSYDEVRSGTLLEAILRSDSLRGAAYMEPLRLVSAGELRDDMESIVADSSEQLATGDASDVAGNGAAASSIDGGPLNEFTVNVTQQAREEQIDPITGRNEEIRQMVDILSRRRKNNPILVGEAGVGKTAIVEGLARRIATGEVPDVLVDTDIRSLDLGLLKAGASVQGEFEERLKSVMEALRAATTPTILFIDEAHTLIGAGGSEGTGDAANLLKPALARGQLRAIAATTWSEYKQYIEKDPALERRFQLVTVDEPSVEEAANMLRGLKAAYEDHHEVQITDRAVDAVAKLADRYISGRQLPDKAVDLLDTASARVKMSLSTRPSRLVDVERELRNFETEIEGIERDLEVGVDADCERLAALKGQYQDLERERETLRARWQREKGLANQIVDTRDHILTNRSVSENGTLSGSEQELSENGENLEALEGELASVQEGAPMVYTEVNEAVAADVISDWTGIPVGSMLEDEADLLLNLEGRLGEHILGQDGAVEEVAEAIRTSKTNLDAPEAPLGVFLFVGPSGVGKTETALRIADLLFGGEQFLTTINMSEYQEKHTAAQLKGSPPGYVGYGEGGVLTEAVRQRSYSVVLLDEIEKAHRDVMNLFYQVFDKGFMRDGEGREIDFRNTVIIMTSNLASETITRLVRERDGSPSIDEVRDAIHPSLVDHFQPALLGRMRVVPYFPLDEETMRNIAAIKLGEVGDRLRESHDVDFSYDPSVVDTIASRCTRNDVGARNVGSIIQRMVVPSAAEILIPRMTDEHRPSTLTLDVDEEGGLEFSLE